MSGGCPKVGNFSDQKWGISVIAVRGVELSEPDTLVLSARVHTTRRECKSAEGLG